MFIYVGWVNARLQLIQRKTKCIYAPYQVRIRLIICSAVIPVQPYLERNTSIPHLLAQPTRDFARRHRETLGESARRFEFKAK